MKNLIKVIKDQDIEAYGGIVEDFGKRLTLLEVIIGLLAGFGLYACIKSFILLLVW